MSPAAASLRELLPLLPEGVLACGFGVALVVDLPARWRARGTSLWVGLAFGAAALAFALLSPATGAASTQLVDATAWLARPLILTVTLLVLLAGAGEQRGTADRGAWAAAVLATGLGSLLVASAANLTSLWLGLELIALSGYVLAAWRGGDRRAAEAGMKFVLFGGAVSGVMLFGMSHVYGLTGHLDFAGIGSVLAAGMPAAVAAALCLAGAGLAYKLTVVPFHLYAPDVYEGAPALSVAAVATVPKVAVAALLLRALPVVLPPAVLPTAQVSSALAVTAMLGLAVAVFTALAQRDGKRILAFSGIGHAGSLLLALACLPGDSAAAAAFFYLLGYAAANIGAFVCLSVLERDLGACTLERLAGTVQLRPWTVSALCLFLLSLAGVPPLAGFLGKWGVLQQALAVGLAGDGRAMVAWAGLALVVSTAIAAWAYLMILRAAVFGQPAASARTAGPVPAPTAVVLVVCAAATLLLGLWLDGLPQILRTLSP